VARHVAVALVERDGRHRPHGRVAGARLHLHVCRVRVKMSDVGSVSSYSEYSDEDESVEEGRPATVWLSPSEYNVADLPSLLNSTAKRKKTLESLFPTLADRVYRCKEFPGGVYINEFGEACPDDERTGIYKCIGAEAPEDDLPNGAEAPEGDDDVATEDENDMVHDSEDEYWAQKEAAKRKRSYGSDDDDDDYVDDDESDDEDTASDDTESDDTDGEAAPSAATPSTDANVNLLEHLRSITDEQSRRTDLEHQKRLERIRRQKLVRLVEHWSDTWTTLRKSAFKKQPSNGKRRKNESIEMKYEANIVLSEKPECEFEFHKPFTRTTVTAAMNCTEKSIVCQCSKSFTDIGQMYKHLDDEHFVTKPMIA